MIGIYARVSTEEQAKNGFSLQDQVSECRKKAMTTEVMEYIDEGISGEFLDRPALGRLREDVRNGIIKKVICLDPDRLSRKLMNQLLITDEFDKRSVDLVFINGDYAKTPEGNLFYSMRGAISEFEKAKINERMSRGRRAKAKQGRVLRDFQIYGYNYDKQTEQIIVNEEEERVVKLIYHMFTTPHEIKGINGIAKYLTDRGIPTKKGSSVWHRQVVRQILMNKAYIGEFYQNRWNTEGMLANKHREAGDRIPARIRPKEEWIQMNCPRIIDDATFSHAQRLLNESRRRWTKQSKNQYLLSGLLRCGECHNTMTGRVSKNWGKKVAEYTDRKNYSGAKHSGCGRKVKCEELDQQVWEQIVAWLNQPDEISSAAEQLAGDETFKSFDEVEIERMEKEITKIKSGRKRLFKLFNEEPDLEEEIRAEIRDLKQKEEDLVEKLAVLKEKQEDHTDLEYSFELIKQASEYYLQKGTDNLAFEDKRELTRQIVREILVYKDRVEIYTF
ncbi:recombinase family protein [Croceifilum oryzae]|uniref:recombinase family protein n=1 Tax=Croceifilum oryzae TaxID=1553429 RepID=UPI0027D7E69C|nr:recombinase family protein [Croceifilum oryzae]